MHINPNVFNTSNIVKAISNPARPWGTVIEEVPADIGRTINGYKRGGILEGAEKFRKEVLSAIVWICGIPFFKKMGDAFCEKALTIPTKFIDFSNAHEGNDAISDTANFLLGKLDNIKDKEKKDFSELDYFIKNGKFMKKLKTKFNNAESLIKNISTAKKVTSIAAIILNCIMMGIAIPKFNQKLTMKKLKKMEAQKAKNNASFANFTSLNDYQKKTKPTSTSPAFKGNILSKISNAASWAAYKTENSSRFALLSTDIPMIVGRCATSRGIMEAFEFAVGDGAAAYFYNFANPHTQKLLRKFTKIPEIQPILIDKLTANPEQLHSALKMIHENPEVDLFKTAQQQKPDTVLKNILGEDLAVQIYKLGTYDKYGKANRFIKDETISEINGNIKGFFEHLQKQSKEKNQSLFSKDGLNSEFIKKISKTVKYSNAIYLAAGLGISILGLSILVPKATYALTRMITGKNEFTGLANYNKQQEEKAKKA